MTRGDGEKIYGGETMKKAVMYGGGNIGRGFVGAIFSKAGYEVTFIDVAEPVISEINARGEYPVRLSDNSGFSEEIVKNVRAVNGNDTGKAADEIADCDIMATAVGARILKFIVPNIAEGLRRRWKKTDRPLNILICENLNEANKILEELLLEQLTGPEKKLLAERVGLVEASVGRMVPIQTEDMKQGDPLRICTERYSFLPVDKAAFKGEIPEIADMIPFEPFDFYVKRKLYIHNMGHAVCAYLGMLSGSEYIFRSIDDPEILQITENAMIESAMALSKEYDMPLDALIMHIQDLIERFGSELLRDTCARVGADPSRKLGKADRLIGAGELCLKHGILPAYIAIGAAGAVYAYLKETGKENTPEEVKTVLKTVSGIETDDELAKLILESCANLSGGAALKELRKRAQSKKYLSLNSII